MKEVSQKLVKADLDRFKKNKFGANLALLGLVFECLYFMLVYGIKSALESDGLSYTKFCSIDIGVSVILTLVILLVSFLSSEGVKGYNKKFCIVLLVLAAAQIGKIFWLPLYGYKEGLLTVNYFGLEPHTPGVNGTEFAFLIIYLVASAACFVASAVISYLRCVQLEKHVKAIESGEVDMDKLLAELDAADEAKAVAAENAVHEEKVIAEPDAANEENVIAEPDATNEESVATEQVEAQSDDKEVE